MKYVIIAGLFLLPPAVAYGIEPMLVECQTQMEMWRSDRVTPGLAEQAMHMECPDPYARVMPVFKSSPRLRQGGRSRGPEPSRNDEERVREEREERERQERERLERERQQAFEKAKGDLQHSLKGGRSGGSGLELKTTGSSGSGLTLKTGSPLSAQPAALISPAVRREQDEYDWLRAEWLRKQQELIRQSVACDTKWRREVMASIKAIKVPNPAARPKELDDLMPGDILLMGLDGTVKAEAIAFGDALYRAIDAVYGGRAAKPAARKPSVYHALTFIKSVDGKRLYLNHSPGGSRLLDEEGLLREYGGQLVYIAKPQAKVDGRILWEVAREAALKQKSDYGVFGNSVVCSERAAIAVAKATGTDMDKQTHLYGLGGIDITPADFFDEKHVGKFFLISTLPIVLRGK